MVVVFGWHIPIEIAGKLEIEFSPYFNGIDRNDLECLPPVVTVIIDIFIERKLVRDCLLYTSDAADE